MIPKSKFFQNVIFLDNWTPIMERGVIVFA